MNKEIAIQKDLYKYNKLGSLRNSPIIVKNKRDSNTPFKFGGDLFINYSKKYIYYFSEIDNNLINIGLNLNTIPIYKSLNLDLGLLYNNSESYSEYYGLSNISYNFNKIFQLNVGGNIGYYTLKDNINYDLDYLYYIGLNTKYNNYNINLYFNILFPGEYTITLNTNITYKLLNNINIEPCFTLYYVIDNSNSFYFNNKFNFLSKINLPITIKSLKIIPFIEYYIPEFIDSDNPNDLSNDINYGINITIPF